MKSQNDNKGIVFLGIGFELIAMCVGGYFMGDYIDQQMGWNGFARTYLVLALLVSWFTHLFYLLRKFEREAEDEGDQGPPKAQ